MSANRYRYGIPEDNGYDVQVRMDETFNTRLSVAAGTIGAITIEKAINTGLRNSEADRAEPGSVYDEIVTQPAREFVIGLRDVGKKAPGTLYPMPKAVSKVALRGLDIMDEGERIVDDQWKEHTTTTPQEAREARDVKRHIQRQEESQLEQAVMLVDRQAMARQQRS